MITALVHVSKPKPPNRLAEIVLTQILPILAVGGSIALGWYAHDYQNPTPRFIFQPVVADSTQSETWSTRYVLGNIAETQFKDRRKGECTVYYQQITACEKGGR